MTTTSTPAPMAIYKLTVCFGENMLESFYAAQADAQTAASFANKMVDVLDRNGLATVSVGAVAVMASSVSSAQTSG